MKNRKKIQLLLIVLFSILLTEKALARMSGAGAGLLGGGIGFLAGSMIANSANNRRDRSYYEEPQVVYTTIDKRPINNHYYYNKKSSDQKTELYDTDDYDNIDSQIDDTDAYEYKVVKIKKK